VQAQQAKVMLVAQFWQTLILLVLVVEQVQQQIETLLAQEQRRTILLGLL
jgi:hypothetical protein